ncbi:DUF1177 domain-containing protein [Nesterenkonia halophila]|uniref:DUF1177 domain-containing protein n=1 Tax=Nesterenkonia halophila TaxID=302044 RepID=UPI00129094E1|nr:DUF1177 domain-containing protein [Nesterenkonia halophila]
MLREVMDSLDLLDAPTADGERVAAALRAAGAEDVEVTPVATERGSTDFLRLLIPGTDGADGGGEAPTLGIIGRLGGIGARPSRVGFVSDGDGAAAAVACALKLSRMRARGDRLAGDVVLATHICPDAPTLPHRPVEFMDSPVDISTMNRHEVCEEMDAILSIDTTKGNRLVNSSGVSLTPAVLDGYVLKVPEDLLDVLESTTGRPAVTLPITTQDITPYGNGLSHINSIMQPATEARVPVVGVAITAETTVPGSATGASHEGDIASAARFCLEAAQRFGRGTADFVDPEEVATLHRLYGSLRHLSQQGA